MRELNPFPDQHGGSMKTNSYFRPINSRNRQARDTAVWLLGIALLAGCNQSAQPPAGAGGQKVVIKGSNTVGEELAPRLIAEYKKDHADAAFELETKGSASGFWGLIAGVSDIAASSRGMIEDEQRQAQVHGVELNDHVIGSYCVAV